MGKQVYANGKEIVAKASDCKVVAAMPDVCMSPPSPPAGPLPVPYPDSSFAKDLKDGSKQVKIGSQPVALQDDSHYKSSPLGDEASTKSFGANILDHGNAGKTFNAAFSMDVSVEGKKVPRAMDLTTSNHSGKQPSGGAMGPNIGGMATGAGGSEGSEEKKCECCGGPLHSDAQSRAPMTSEQFYSPSYPPPAPPPNTAERHAINYVKNIIAMAKEDGCGNMVHDDDTDPCAKHYPTSGPENNRVARPEFNAMMSPLTPLDTFTSRYGEKLGKEIQARGQQLSEAMKDKSKVASIGHRTPLTAGGCPVGGGNLQPVSPHCHMYEKELGSVQGKIALYHRRVHGL
jgi:hypothetical protein